MHTFRLNNHTSIGITYFNPEDTPHYLAYLHPNELKHYDSLQYDNKKRDFLLGRYTARKAIEALNPPHYNRIYLDAGVLNQPIIRGQESNLCVSISHSESIGSALVYDEATPMAIDIEKSTPQLTRVVSYYKRNELQLCASFDLSHIEKLTLLWTIKESLSKVLRTGLTTDFGIYELESITKNDTIYQSRFKNFIQYEVSSFLYKDSVISILYPIDTILQLSSLQSLLLNKF